MTVATLLKTGLTGWILNIKEVEKKLWTYFAETD